MPSLEWNRRFGVDVIRFARRNSRKQFYGDQWGLVEDRDELMTVRRKFLDPFVSGNKVCLEIGSGGGRWTQYLLGCRELVCVELNREMFDYIRGRFNDPQNVSYVTTNGHDLPSVPHDHVDFIFSFGTFVHLEMETIARYVESMALVMKPGADVVLQVSNRHKRQALTDKPSFSDNSPEFMVDTFSRNGIRVLDVDNDVLLHSTMIHGRKS
jgi:cyclopropane fatty-acyl-phospholipid synthase-like methyltransferase